MQVSTAFCASSAEATLALTKRTFSPNSLASALPRSSLISTITALAPPATSLRTQASPKPEAPPLTRAPIKI
ncbi:MAG: hypothetical protein FD167_4420 [bacterium]|nr:MAG: hypothetical protein FD167_4420 [bacterium]